MKPPLSRCPHCQHLGEKGKLVFIDKLNKDGKRVKFWGCSSYKKGCRYIYSAKNEAYLKALEAKLKGRNNKPRQTK